MKPFTPGSALVGISRVVSVAFAFTLLAFAGSRLSADEPLEAQVEHALGVSLVRLERSVAEVKSPKLYPTYATPALRWQLKSSEDWTSGFYPGCLWYAYALSHDKRFAGWARQWSAGIAREKNNRKTHDLGFRFGCSYGNALRFDPGPESPHDAAMLHTAAATLGRRFNARVGCLSSNWDRPYRRGTFPVVIDIMMNLELLLWSSAHGGPAELAEYARRHGDTTLRDFVRPDGGTYHVVRYDPNTGAVLKKGTLQGAADESTWSRGQAWAQYGFVVLYRYTHDARYLEAAQRLADYFIDHLPPDHVAWWDFQSPDHTPDASATAVVASALFEMVNYLPDPARKAHYRAEAEAMLGALCRPPYFAGKADTNCLLDHSTQYLPIRSNVDVPAIFADYYFLEAVARFRGVPVVDGPVKPAQ